MNINKKYLLEMENIITNLKLRDEVVSRLGRADERISELNDRVKEMIQKASQTDKDKKKKLKASFRI